MQKEYIVLIISGILVVFAIWIFYKGLERKIHAYYKRQARKVYKKINSQSELSSPSAIISYLRKISPYVFEELILLAYEKKGYKVKRNKRYSGDGGIDGYVSINKEWIPIQAKRYKSYIKRQHVVDFEELVLKRKKPYGLFIHTGRTGRGSSGNEFSHVRFLSGSKLVELLIEQNIKITQGKTYHTDYQGNNLK